MTDDLVDTRRPAVLDAHRIFPGDLSRIIAATERITGMDVFVINEPPRFEPGHLFPTGRKPPGSKLRKKFARGMRVRGH